MNYGKNKASKKQKEITSKATMQSKRIGVRLFKAFLLCLLFIVIACIIAGFVFLKKIIDDSPDITAEDVRPSGYTSIAYADDGVTEIELLCNLRLEPCLQVHFRDFGGCTACICGN